MSEPTPDLARELTRVLNIHCCENESNTPDYILADYMLACLKAYEIAMKARASWYGRMDEPGRGSQPYPRLPDNIKKLYAEGPVFLRSDNHE